MAVVAGPGGADVRTSSVWPPPSSHLSLSHPMPFLVLQEPVCVCSRGSAPRCRPSLPPEDGVGVPSAGPVWGGDPGGRVGTLPIHRVRVLTAQTTEWSFQQAMEPGRSASCWPGPRPSRLPQGDPRLPLAAASWPGPGPGSTAACSAVNQEELGA